LQTKPISKPLVAKRDEHGNFEDLLLAIEQMKMLPHFLKLMMVLSATLLLVACDKSAPASSGGMATQGSPPPAGETYDGVDLAQMTRDLKRWVVGTKERPTSFEEYVAKSKATVPPAPPGKKFAISKEMRVILVDR